MKTLYASRKRLVHIMTPMARDILRLPIKKASTVAKLVGCRVDYVYMIRALKRSRAHVFISEQDHENLGETRGRKARREC